MTPEQAHFIREAKAFLLDFDGPVCSAFAGYPAPKVAKDLLRLGGDTGTPLPRRASGETDPMKVLELLYELAPQNHPRAEAFLTDAEVHSVAWATPTPGVTDFLVAAHKEGTPVAVVSNNSPEAIRAFLKEKQLEGLVSSVVGRKKSSPLFMKPHPHLLEEALQNLREEPEQTMMIGDSVTDIEASHAARVFSVGYANRPEKVQAFNEHKAGIVVTSMGELAGALLTG